MSKKAKKQVVYYGLAANPPHKGHADVVRQLLAAGNFVIISPSAGHPFGKKTLDYATRLAMTTAWAQEFFKDEPVVVSRLEEIVQLDNRLDRSDSRVFTIDVLQWIEKNIGVKAKCVVGPDNAHPDVWKKFRDFAKIDRNYGKVVVAERLPVRSTLIREKLANGEPEAAIASLTGDAVADYIFANGGIDFFKRTT